MEPEHVAEVTAKFAAVGVTAAAIAEVDDTFALDLEFEGQVARYWDLAAETLMGFGRSANPTRTQHLTGESSHA